MTAASLAEAKTFVERPISEEQSALLEHLTRRLRTILAPAGAPRDL